MTISFVGVLLGIIGWMGFNYLRLRQAAKIVDNGEFEDLIRQGQLVDLRDPSPVFTISIS